jgi:hypothetical protein
MDKFEARTDDKKAGTGGDGLTPTPNNNDQATFHNVKNASLARAQSTVQEEFGTPSICSLDEKQPDNPQDQTHTSEMPSIPDKSLPAAIKRMSPPFSNEKPTDAEIEWFKNIATAKEIELVKKEINQSGEQPQAAILDSVKSHRVVGLGETHQTPNGLRTMLELMMPDLKAAGVTHLALELRQQDQEFVNRAATGDEEAIRKLETIYAWNDDTTRLIQAAAKASIKLVTVDKNFPEGTLPAASEFQERDNVMAKAIQAIVESDPNARVLSFGGRHHWQRREDDNYLSLAEQLSARGKEKGYTVTTFAAYLEGPQEGSVESSATFLAKTITRAVSLETSKTKFFKNLPVSLNREEEQFLHHKEDGLLGKYDNVLIVPLDTALKVTEEKYGKDSPEIINRLRDLGLEWRHLIDRSDQGPALLSRALKLAEQHFGKRSKQTAECHAELGNYFDGATDADSRGHLETALSIFEEKANGKFTPELSRSYMDLIRFHRENTPYEAMKYFNLASTYLKNDTEKIKSEHWLGTGRFLIRGLNKSKTAAKVDLPPVAKDFLKNYAGLLNEVGEKEEAKKIIDRLK